MKFQAYISVECEISFPTWSFGGSGIYQTTLGYFKIGYEHKTKQLNKDPINLNKPNKFCIIDWGLFL